MSILELTDVIKRIDHNQIDLLKTHILEADEIILIGNGGSNSIASHMAVDYTKFLQKRCYVPNACDMVTMIVNDYGSDNMYSKFIEYCCDDKKSQLAIIISSSGNSQNIINAASECQLRNIPMILLSGFYEDNRLNTLAYSQILQKYWVDSKSYGVVEMSHHIYLHSII